MTQLPVEDLRFRQEADFPGFLKYDSAFSEHPRGQKIQYMGANYASYDLQKFLIFPLNSGDLKLPEVDCDLRVRVPSGSFSAADLMLNVDRSSNAITLKVRPLPSPQPQLIGNYSIRQEILSDSSGMKLLKYKVEGRGELSTFEWEQSQIPGAEIRTLSGQSSAEIRGESL